MRHGARFVGRATTKLAERTGPTTVGPVVCAMAGGATMIIICKLPGQSVGGNNRWYYLSDGRWVSARYLDNVGHAPGWCN